MTYSFQLNWIDKILRFPHSEAEHIARAAIGNFLRKLVLSVFPSLVLTEEERSGNERTGDERRYSRFTTCDLKELLLQTLHVDTGKPSELEYRSPAKCSKDGITQNLH